MPRDPELMAKLAEIASMRPEEVVIEDLLEMCELLERHEDEQHQEYARIARKEGYPAVAKIFEELAVGERFYHDSVSRTYKKEVM